MADVRSGLLEIGILLEKRAETFGVAPKSPDDYIKNAIDHIRRLICPRKKELLDALKDPRTELAVVVFDLISPTLGNPVPGLGSVSRAIAQIGIERFCSDPRTLGMIADE